MKKKCVLFDFDCTLTLRDTTRFLIYSFLWNRPFRFFQCSIDLIRLIFSFYQSKQIQNDKNLYLSRMLKGCSILTLQKLISTYVNLVEKELREVTNEKIQEYIDNDFEVIIVTASPRVFVEAVYSSKKIKVLGVEFNLKGPVLSGEVLGAGCFGDQKVDVLDNWCLKNGLNLRFFDAWSDSLSDKAIMLLAEKRYWLCPPCDAMKVKIVDPDGLIVNTSGV